MKSSATFRGPWGCPKSRASEPEATWTGSRDGLAFAMSTSPRTTMPWRPIGPSATTSTLMAAYSDQKKDFRLSTAPGRLLFAGSDSSVHPEEQLENGTIWHHLDRHHIAFRNFGEGFELAGVYEGKDLEPTGAGFLTNVPMPDPLYRNTSRQYPGFNMNIPDQFRATQFIQEMEEMALDRK